MLIFYVKFPELKDEINGRINDEKDKKFDIKDTYGQPIIIQFLAHYRQIEEYSDPVTQLTTEHLNHIQSLIQEHSFCSWSGNIPCYKKLIESSPYCEEDLQGRYQQDKDAHKSALFVNPQFGRLDMERFMHSSRNPVLMLCRSGYYPTDSHTGITQVGLKVLLSTYKANTSYFII